MRELQSVAISTTALIKLGFSSLMVLTLAACATSKPITSPLAVPPPAPSLVVAALPAPAPMPPLLHYNHKSHESGPIAHDTANQDEFEAFHSNPYKRVKDTPVSTFSADVDTASYSFTRQYVKRGEMPPKDAVRVEEMINYFDYDYKVPRSRNTPFKPCLLYTSPSPRDGLLSRMPSSA